MSGVAVLVQLCVWGAVVGAFRVARHLFECRAAAVLGISMCSVWSCTEAGEFTEPDGSPRCMEHVGVDS